MASQFVTLLKRDNSTPVGPPIIGLIVALLVLLVVALGLAGALLFMRRRRRIIRMQELSLQIEKRSSTSSSNSSHRRVMGRPSESAHVYYEKQALMEESESIPESPLPEIRVTFPEEYDEAGKRTSGRVVTVHVGETGVAYAPVGETHHEEYDHERFQSLDLERIGGLVEKIPRAPKQSWY